MQENMKENVKICNNLVYNENVFNVFTKNQVKNIKK